LLIWLQVFVRENRTPPRITERRFRIFLNDHDDTEDESPQSKSLKNSLKFQLLSSSSIEDQCLYQSGSFSSADTVIEEQWTESTMTSISLLRITSSTFDKPPFLDPSYGQDIAKLSFEGPCCPKDIYKALKYFPGISSLEFSHGFFSHEDYDNDELTSRAPAPLEVLQEIKSLTMTCDSKKYFALEETQQKQMNLRILSLIENVLGSGLSALDYCNLSFPNAPDLERHLTPFIFANNANKGEKRVDYTNNQVSEL